MRNNISMNIVKLNCYRKKMDKYFLNILMYTTILLQNILQIILLKSGHKEKYSVCHKSYMKKSMEI